MTWDNRTVMEEGEGLASARVCMVADGVPTCPGTGVPAETEVTATSGREAAWPVAPPRL